MRRTIELYGRLRDAGLGASAVVDLPARCTARQALAAARAAFAAKAHLLTGCVLADGDAVLGPAERVPAKGRLALLPPVCGG